MDSKAIAVVIIGVGIMVLIVSAAIGAPTDGMVRTFLGWPAQANMLTLPAVPTLVAAKARALPLMETDTRPERGDDLACAISIKLKLPSQSDQSYCSFVGQIDAARHWQCGARFVHHCVDDAASTEDQSPEILDVRLQAKYLDL